MPPDRTLRIEFDGKGVEPSTVDTFSVLRFTASYIGFLRKIAEHDGKSLTFSGIGIEHKCAAISMTASAVTTLESSVRKADKWLSSPIDAPREVKGELQHVIRMGNVLPAGYNSTVIVRKKKHPLPIRQATPKRSAAQGTREVVALRVLIAEVGGTTSPHVKLQSPSEARQFTLKTSKETAKEFGSLLYEEADIVALIERDDDGHIVTGEITELHRLEDGDSVVAWDKWYAANDQGWSQVEDVEVELGRELAPTRLLVKALGRLRRQ